jgi:hypothetical protein
MYMGWHGNKCDHQQEHNTKCMTYSYASQNFVHHIKWDADRFAIAAAVATRYNLRLIVQTMERTNIVGV